MALNPKKALALALSAAMVVTAAPSATINADAAAKKPTITASKTINAGKTASIKVTTQKKNRYIKLTSIGKSAKVTIKAKVGGKTQKLKKNKYYKVTGKSVTLKVTGTDAVADYTSAIKVQVFDKSKKKYKKVGKVLTSKVKVKATKLEVVSVERTASSGKYLTATFTKALDSLRVADITIEETATGIKKGVESVSLSSNGKSATISLVGSESGVNEFVEPLKEYTFSVTQGGVTASTKFIVDDVDAECIVIKTDADKKKIETDASGELTVPSNIKIDYEGILGNNVTVWFDQDHNLTKIVDNSKKVVYGAFKVTEKTAATATIGATYTFKNIATDEEYETLATGKGVNSTIRATIRYEKGKDNAEATTAIVPAGTETEYAYAKLTFNASGTIQSVVSEESWDRIVLVSEVKDNALLMGKSQVNVGDFTFVKEGKTVAISDIKSGDLVFLNLTDKFGEVFTDSKSGALEAVYDGGFKFGGKSYNSKNGSFMMQYVADDGSKDADNDYMNELKASGKDVTVYFDRKGAPVYISGEQATTVSNTTSMVLTKAVKLYRQSLINYIRISGYDTKDKTVKDVDIDVSKLKKIVGTDTMIYEENKAIEKKDGSSKDANKVVKEFEFLKHSTEANVDATFNANKNAGVRAIYKDGSTGAILTPDGNGFITDLSIGEIVKLRRDANGVVTGIDLTEGKTVNNATAIEKDSKTLNGKQLSASAPVYTYKAKTNGTEVEVKEMKFNVLNTKIAAANANVYVYYDDDAKNIEAITIDADKVTLNNDDTKTIEVVVESAKKNTDGDFVSLVGYSEGKKVEYSSFKDDVSGSYSIGDVVDVELASDEKTVNKITDKNADSATGMVNVRSINTSDKKFDLVVKGVNGTYEVAKEVTPTIVKIKTPTGTSDKTLEVVGFEELLKLNTEKNTVKVSYLGTDVAHIDAIIIVETEKDADGNQATMLTKATNAVAALADGSDSDADLTDNTALANYKVANVNTLALYKEAEARIANAKAKCQLLVDVGGKASDVPSYGDIAAREAELKATGETLITEVNGVSGTVITASGTDIDDLNAPGGGFTTTAAAVTATNERFAQEYPVKLAVTWANGTTKEYSANDMATWDITYTDNGADGLFDKTGDVATYALSTKINGKTNVYEAGKQLTYTITLQ